MRRPAPGRPRRGVVGDAASAGGDMDTTCAMVGGIVAARTGLDGVPGEWVNAREALPPL
ncbi:ADP-ribosylglycohydrolase family protein [Dactylosporangium sp. NPDC000244]|uniref:ADP-ribosylglycohydrolase family protein n=1 Tax=Dactylosporangium sp. NPDC000244 TaxID=3154365 RepID=UPI003328BB1B